MRFARLSLERYGHFADCEMTFRSGSPDLHIIYGANEAGKTTSMAAVSDLLFGFPARSPYNFVYDYSWLRIGALLEEGGSSFACRRKKGTTSTLVDADDRPLDEVPLLAMLRGQTRETFSLSHSLNQEGLRDGGRAMVEARNDLGRALFAAGSGLTGISEHLSKLEAEADAIWAPRKSARRSFTIAQTELEAQTRAVRDLSLKPKIWSDARAEVARTLTALKDAQTKRDEVLAEQSRIERIRRIAPSVRLRAEQLETLAEHAQTIELSPQRERTAETAIADAEAAKRARSVAQKLRDEARDKLDALDLDTEVLTYAERIDDLVLESGAVAKGRQDRVRLEVARAAADTLIQRLRTETGVVGEPPNRIRAARLRELALQHGEDASALKQIEESEADLARRRAQTADQAPEPEIELGRIVCAVDAARSLGADVDARCASLQQDADGAATSLEHALAKLAPWAGTAEGLSGLPHLSHAEIDEVRTRLGELSAEISREADAAERAREDERSLALEADQLSSGSAVRPDVIADARAQREEHWRPLRESVLTGAQLPAPERAVRDYENSVADADGISDQRFAAADESSRLADLIQRRARLTFKAEQAEGRSARAEQAKQAVLSSWYERLTQAGYPPIEPTRMNSWLADKTSAELAAQAFAAAARQARALIERRDAARTALTESLEPDLTGGTSAVIVLAPILAIAERFRSDAEDASKKRLLAKAAEAQIELEAQNLERRRQRLEQAGKDRESSWRGLMKEIGLTLEIASAIAILDGLDELRAALSSRAELQGRIDGLDRDADAHERELRALEEALHINGTGDVIVRLGRLRQRLAVAREAATLAKALNDTIQSRSDEVSAEAATIGATDEALASVLAETHSSDSEELGEAIERSRAKRALKDKLAGAEAAIIREGDGKTLEELLEAMQDVDMDDLAGRANTLSDELARLNEEVEEAASAHGDARRAFTHLDQGEESAFASASAAEQARSELAVLAEDYILKRAQWLTLRWVIEQYRERHQDPMLLRAGQIFSTLTLGRYVGLRIDNDQPTPRLLGVRDDQRTLVEIGGMSEGTSDQLFLALRLAALEQSIEAGVRLPFLADDLFVNFDDERSRAGFQVLAEVAQATQVLFFTHHPHLAAIARDVVGADVHSECSLG